MARRGTARLVPLRIVFQLRCCGCDMELAIEQDDDDKDTFDRPEDPRITLKSGRHIDPIVLDCESCGAENKVPRSKILAMFKKLSIVK